MSGSSEIDVIGATLGQFASCIRSGESWSLACAQAQNDARVALASLGKKMDAATDLLEAAQIVLAGLNARIDAAPSSAKPVFNGIADLHDAIERATAGEQQRSGA